MTAGSQVLLRWKASLIQSNYRADFLKTIANIRLV